MESRDPYCHSASIDVAAPAAAAFAFMADGLKQGRWAFGSWDREALEGGVFAGTSLFSGARTYVRIRADRDHLMVHYDVGGAPDAGELMPRIVARIVPGPVLSMGENECVVSLIAWRTREMSDRRWHQLQVSHETQVLIIKHQIESKQVYENKE